MVFTPTIRIRAYRDLPRPRPSEFSGTFSIGGRHEPLPLRLFGRTQRALSVYAGADSALSQQALRAVAGPDRLAPDRGTGDHCAEPDPTHWR